MGRLLLGLVLGVLALLPGPLPAAEIEGKVNLPPAAPVTRVDNQRYGPAVPVPKAPVVAVPKPGITYVEGAAMPTPRVAVVYLEGKFPEPVVAPAIRRIEQKDQTFSPAFIAIRVGTKVEFPNLDAIFHNVFSLSPAKQFDLGRFRPGESPPPVLFEKPGLVTVRCDIHVNMRALILVVPTSHFVVSDSEGRFRLTDIPPGVYKLKVWKDSNTTLEREVVVPDSGALHVDFP